MTTPTLPNTATALLVECDPPAAESSRELLLQEGIATVVITDPRAVMPFLEQQDVSLVLFGLSPAISGIGLLSQLCATHPDIPVIVVSTSADLELAVDCMRSGAFDYLVRPVDREKLAISVANAQLRVRSQLEMPVEHESPTNEAPEHAEAFAEITTASRQMRSLFRYTEIIACSPQPVLITGETGVGKELFARAIHRISKLRGPFVSINVAGLDDAMFSDTLFGHKKGAFTDADQHRDGLVSKAAFGTLFLDEIGDLNELSQVKLLRLLQEREYYQVGADQVKTSNARILLATNLDLQERIREGRFRRDLYYRLCTHQVRIPPLRERRDDIPPLVATFVGEAASRFGKSPPEVSAALSAALAEYDFPGNVRELQAIINDAVARHEEGMLTPEDFPCLCTVPKQNPPLPAERMAGTSGIYGMFGRLPTFREIEDQLLVEAMKLTEGNYAMAAGILGVTRQTISKRLKSIESSASCRQSAGEA